MMFSRMRSKFSEVRPRITADRLPREVAGVPVPGVPREVAFEQVAALSAYRFDVTDRNAPVEARKRGR